MCGSYGGRYPISRGMKERLVIDASVAGKWYLDDERHIDNARAVRSRYLSGEAELRAPDFFRYELPALIHNAVIKKRITKEHAQRLIKDFHELRFPVAVGTNTDEFIRSAAELASRYDCAFYDALYLLLAEELGWPFLTDEEELPERLEGKVDYVVRLKDY